MTPRVIVVQTGARHAYAVPRLLEERAALVRLVTDYCRSDGVESRRLPFLGDTLGDPAARRRVTGVPADKIVSVWSAAVASLAARRLAGVDRFEDALLSRAALAAPFLDANCVYASFGAGERFLEEARRRGLLVASEIFITPVAHRIEDGERRAHPSFGEAPLSAEAAARIEAKVRRTIGLSDLLLCPSETVIDGLAAYPEFKPKQARLVRYAPATLPTARSRPVRGRVLLVGSAILRKGIHVLAEAAAHLKSLAPGVEIVVAGGVAEAVLRHPACHALTFLGHLGAAEIASEFAKADLFALPTLAEGSATVVFEALAAGVPVVTTRSAGSVIRDGVDGLVVTERDAGALARAILAVVGDRHLRARLGAEALRTASRHTHTTWGDALVAMLSEALMERRKAA